MKDTISIGYADVTFRNENLIEQILKKKFRIVYDNNNPDLLFCSIFGNTRHNRKGKTRIIWTGENVRLNLNNFDYAIGFDYVDHERYLRFPLWKFYLHLDERKHLIDELVNKRKITTFPDSFCGFVVTQPAKVRNDFFHYVNQYKKIDSFGRLFNNRPEILRIKESSWTWQQNKINFFRNNPFKFIISFENSSYPGYTTEKLPDAMLCDTIPIYWGDPDIYKDFNTESFINLHDLNNNFEKALNKIKILESDKHKYLEMANKDWLTEKQKNRIYKNELEDFLFKKILKI